MTTTNSRRRTRLLAAGALTAALALTAAGIGVANAATDPPALAFVAATPNVTALRFDNGENHYLDFELGTNLIAGKHPLEIRVNRKSYADPIVAHQVVVKNGRKTLVKLPKELVSGFGGFKNFTTVTIKNRAGATVKTYQTDFCPNSGSSARTRRDAPASSPYPRYCAGENPFTLGSVWGIQAGWNATTRDRPAAPDGGEDEFDLAVGKYTVTVAVNQKYRDFFKIPARSASVKLNLDVVPYVDDQPQPGPSGSAAPSVDVAGATARMEAARAQSARADEHSAHIAGEGDERRQISAYLPGFAPPAKRPVTARSAPRTGPKPDLRSLPAWGISLDQGTDPKTDQPNKKFYISFGATVWNAGTSPLLVDGFRRTGTELMDAYQYFFDAKGKQVGSVPAGTMEWDKREGHKHWHFTDFAQYNLLTADKKRATRSGKEAFCLANTDAVDYTIPHAKWRPDNTDLATACGGNSAVAVREVLDVGNGDTYSQARPGQSFEITGLPNGTYYIEVKANPANKLSELNTKNNSALRKIILGGTPAKRTLKVPPVNGITG
jgi:hypothetical protein